MTQTKDIGVRILKQIYGIKSEYIPLPRRKNWYKKKNITKLFDN